MGIRPGADRAVGAVGHLPAGPERARGLADHTMTATVAVFLIGPPRAARSAVSTRRLPHYPKSPAARVSASAGAARGASLPPPAPDGEGWSNNVIGDRLASNSAKATKRPSRRRCRRTRRVSSCRCRLDCITFFFPAGFALEAYRSAGPRGNRAPALNNILLQPPHPSKLGEPQLDFSAGVWAAVQGRRFATVLAERAPAERRLARYVLRKNL